MKCIIYYRFHENVYKIQKKFKLKIMTQFEYIDHEMLITKGRQYNDNS